MIRDKPSSSPSKQPSSCGDDELPAEGNSSKHSQQQRDEGKKSPVVEKESGSTARSIKTAMDDTQWPSSSSHSSAASNATAGGVVSDPSPLTAGKRSGGMLLRLFQSECFDSHFHMFYLYHREEQGIHDYLVNLLYRRPDEEIHFYLPQLCQLAIGRPRSALSRFLLDKSARSMHLALKGSWLFQAGLEDRIPNLSEAAAKMREETEMAVVNSKPFTTTRDSADGGTGLPPAVVNETFNQNHDLFFRRRVVRALMKNRHANNIQTSRTHADRAIEALSGKHPLVEAPVIVTSGPAHATHIKSGNVTTTPPIASDVRDIISPSILASPDVHILPSVGDNGGDHQPANLLSNQLQPQMDEFTSTEGGVSALEDQSSSDRQRQQQLAQSYSTPTIGEGIDTPNDDHRLGLLDPPTGPMSVNEGNKNSINLSNAEIPPPSAGNVANVRPIMPMEGGAGMGGTGAIRPPSGRKKGRVAPGFVTQSGAITVSPSKVRLSSVYHKLGTPFNYTSFSRESHGVLLEDSEMQQFIIKQRRCEYFNVVGLFISLIIDVSDKLCNEPDKGFRNPLIRAFAAAIDEWILCRRCIVAASEGIFAMTGLAIPFTNYGVEPERATLGVPTPFQAPFLVQPTGSIKEIPSRFSSVQMLRIVTDACRVFSSKKRAPYLFVFELADLDEDLQDIDLNQTNSTERRRQGTVVDEGDLLSKDTNQKEPANESSLLWDDLYVYTAIVDDLKIRELYVPPFLNRPLTKYELGRITSQQTKDQFCPCCIKEPGDIHPLKGSDDSVNDESASHINEEEGSNNNAPSLPDYEFPFCCIECGGTKLFYDAIANDNLLMSLRRSLGVPERLSSLTDGPRKVPVVPIFQPPKDPKLSSPPKAPTTLEVPSKQNRRQQQAHSANVSQSMTNASPRSLSTGRVTDNNDVELMTDGLVKRGAAVSLESSNGGRGRPSYLRRSSSFSPKAGKSRSRSSRSSVVKDDVDVNRNSSSIQPPMPVKRSAAMGSLPSIANMLTFSTKPTNANNSSGSSGGQASNSTKSLSTLATEKVAELCIPGEKPGQQAQRIRQILWAETWDHKKEQIRQSSPYGKLRSWQLGAVIVKGGDDVRQELLASQLILQFKAIFDEAKLPLWLRPYEILVTGSQSGIIEYIPDTQSVDAVKKKFNVDSVAKVFDAAFADNIHLAKRNFIESHAAYSLVGYLLQVKDRHNGNVLLNNTGRIVHIDYGFMLSNSPGYVNFETSPFKLSAEIMSVMGGENSENFEYFKELVIKGFLETRKHAERIFLVVDMMLSASKMPCFGGAPEAALAALKERFMLGISDSQCMAKVLELIDVSINNWRTQQYDNFQRITNGIF